MNQPNPRAVFIIHGRNLEAKNQLGIFLRSCGLMPLNFDDLRASMGGTPTISDIIDRGMTEAQGVIALFTEDEFASLRPQFRSARDRPDDLNRWQARPNVIFEAGIAFGRDRSRVVFVLLGNPALFSDVAGVHVLHPTNDPKGDRKILRETLRKGMGCEVEDSTAWLDQGDLESCVRHLSDVAAQDPFCSNAAATMSFPTSQPLRAPPPEARDNEFLNLYDPGTHTEPVLGISLGITSVCVAVYDGDKAVVAPDRGGYDTIPVVVGVRDTGRRLVGRAARREAIPNAENTAYGFTRLLGRRYDSPQSQNARSISSYRIVQGADDRSLVHLGDQELDVPTLTSFILAEARIIAAQFTGRTPSKAVITVPAYFNDAQRQAVRDSASMANIEVVGLLNEATAACLAYRIEDNDQTVAVYDLGGGAFDVTVVRVTSPGTYNIISTTGDTFLGGEDFDGRVIDWLIEGFLEEHGVDLRQDRVALQRLRDAAERAKCELSTHAETEIELPFIAQRANSSLHLHRSLSRQTFELLVNDLVERSIAICAECLNSVELSASQIDKVILAGGMTQMPLIQSKVQAFFRRRLLKELRAQQVMALGAATQAAAVTGNMTIHSNAPLSYEISLVTQGGHIETLFDPETPLPAKRPYSVRSRHIVKQSIQILVLWRKPESTTYELLGELHIKNLDPLANTDLKLEFLASDSGSFGVRRAGPATKPFESMSATRLIDLTDNDIDAIKMEYGLSSSVQHR